MFDFMISTAGYKEAVAQVKKDIGGSEKAD